VVHGRGTGALRRAIHEWLGSCSQVASFALAPADRGGDGMTIVTLK
ncbi:MAG: Smr/MutS family protein, partial [Desulfovibrio sp.]|nr:Smr/MutS family protein [Desulfovibrio sp.]